MNDKQIPFIVETEATGKTAALFGDIRRTMGTATVNLIWRHLATQGNSLTTLWESVKPLYTSGLLARAVGHFGHTVARPTAAAWTNETLAKAGLDPTARDTVKAVVATYNRGNAFNLLTLSMLLFDGSTTTNAISLPDETSDPFPLGQLKLPPVLELHELAPAVQDQVLALNELGIDGSNHGIVATLYKHIAHWPSLLKVCHEDLAPLHAQGEIQSWIHATKQTAKEHAAPLVASLETRPQIVPDSPTHDTLTAFINVAVARMLPIGLRLTAQLGD